MTVRKMQRLKEGIGSQINGLKRIKKWTIGNSKKGEKKKPTFIKFIPGLWLA